MPRPLDLAWAQDFDLEINSLIIGLVVNGLTCLYILHWIELVFEVIELVFLLVFHLFLLLLLNHTLLHLLLLLLMLVSTVDLENEVIEQPEEPIILFYLKYILLLSSAHRIQLYLSILVFLHRDGWLLLLHSLVSTLCLTGVTSGLVCRLGCGRILDCSLYERYELAEMKVGEGLGSQICGWERGERMLTFGLGLVAGFLGFFFWSEVAWLDDGVLPFFCSLV